MKNLAFIIAVFSGFAAMAQGDQERPDPRGMLRMADADYNEEISAAEWSTFMAELNTTGGNIDPQALHEKGENHRANRPHRQQRQQGQGYGNRGQRDEFRPRNGQSDRGQQQGARGERSNRGQQQGTRGERRGQRPDRNAGGEGQDRAPEGQHPLDYNRDGQLATTDLQAIFRELDQNQDGALQQSELPPPPRRRPRGGR